MPKADDFLGPEPKKADDFLGGEEFPDLGPFQQGEVYFGDSLKYIPPNVQGEVITSMMPGVGVAGAFGKELAFENPESPLPTGVKDVPSLVENVQTGHPFKAAGQALGVIPDLGYAAKGISAAAKIGKPALKAVPKVAETIMSLDDLKAAKNAAYQQAEQAGVVVKPEAFKNFVDGLEATMRREGYDPDLHSNVAPVLKRLRAAADQPTQKSLEDIEILRRVASAGRSAADIKNKDQLVKSYTVLDSIDDFVDNLQPHHLMSGDSDAAVAALKEARQLTNKSKKIEDIEEIVRKGEDLDDPRFVQNQFKSIVKNTKQFNRFTDDEKDIIKKIAKTGKFEGIGRLLSPGSADFLGASKAAASGVIGFALSGGNPVGAVALPLAATGARMAGNAARRGNINKLEQTISRGSAAPGFMDRFRAERAKMRLLEQE